MTTKSILLALVLLLVGVAPAFTQPANDDPCNAFSLDVFSSCMTTTYTNVAATSSVGVIAPGCGTYSGGDVWFTFTLPNNGYHVVLEATMGTMLNGSMAVYEGSCGSLLPIACDDLTDGQLTLRIEDGCNYQNAGETFWLRDWDDGKANNGTFDLCAYATYPAVPVGAVGCSTFTPPGNTCCDATILSDGLDGYCGSTNGYTDDPAVIGSFCAFLDNNSWVAFIAGSEEVELEITSFNCVFGNGIQVAILETSNCTDFTMRSNCWNPGTETSGTVTATNMTPGEIYYLMVDGWAGDICDYTIRVIEGIQTTEVTVSEDSICAGETVQLMANVIGVGPFSYQWSPAGSLNDATISNPVASPTVSTDYSVTITGAQDSIHTVSVHVDVNPPPAPAIAGPTIVCEGATGEIYAADMPQGRDYNWSLSGGGSIIGSSTDSTVRVDWGMVGGTLCLTVSNECGPSQPGCITITTIPRPNISANDPVPVCAPNTIDLTTITINNSSMGGGPVSYYATEADALAGSPTLATTVVASSGTYWIRMDSGPNCFDHTSVDITIQDPQIFVNPPPTTCAPNTVDLRSLLINETNSVGPPSSLTYYADSLDGVNRVNQLSSPVVSTSGTYWIRYETSVGCFDVGSVAIDIFEQPQVSFDHPLIICAGESLDLDTLSCTDAYATTIISKLFFTSSALAASGLPALAMSSTVVSDAGPYFMRLDTDNGCFAIVEINITLRSQPEGSLSATASVCTGSTANLVFNLSGLPPFTIVYSDGTNNITIPNISQIAHTETVTINATTTFSLVSVDDATTCSGLILTAPVTVTATPLPTFSIGTDATICAGENATLVYNFTGNGPFSVSLSDGSNTISRTGLVNGDTELFNPSTSTTYTPVSVTDALGCTGTVSGSATINVNDPLQVVDLIESCNSNFDAYTVTFEIVGGDPATYAVTGNTGTLVGTQFTSDAIPAGTAYSFTVSDAGPCADVTASGIQNCTCSNDAGLMDANPIEVCADESVTAAAATGTGLQTGHFLQYALHDNPGGTLGTVFAISATPTFALQAGMQLNTTYYISPIVGPDDGSGQVNTNHTCFDLAPGTPVIFVERPVATIGRSVDICTGEIATLTINFTAGVPPFDVVYSDGSTSTTLEDITDGHTFNVSPVATTIYNLVSVIDNTGATCTGSVGGSAIVTVWDGPVASPVSFECDAFNENFRVIFSISGGDPASYAVSGDAGNLDNATQTFTSAWYANGSTYSFQISDANNCDPIDITGNHECPCTSFAGTMDGNLLEACEGETVSFNHQGNQVLDGNDALGYILHDGGATAPGIILLTNTAPEFTYDPALTLGQTYYVSAVVANDNGTGFPVTSSALDRCLSVSEGQPIRFDPISEAWLMGAASICEGESTSLTFQFADPGTYDVIWTDGTTTFSEVGISSGQQVTVSPTATTTYTLQSATASGGALCASQINPAQASVTVDVTEVPEAQNVNINCDNLGATFVISFEIVGGNASCYAVAGNGGQLAGNVFTSEPIVSGSTYLFEITDGSGCPPVTLSATEYCNCTPDIQAAIAVESGISCPGGADGQLTVANVNGEGPFEFNWSTGVTGTTVQDLNAGWYYVTMVDANLCNRQDSIFLGQPDSIRAEIELVDASCNGEADGQLLIDQVTGGSGFYRYSLSDLVTNTETPAFFNLDAATYELTISDQNGCSTVQSLEITEPDELTVDLGEDLRLVLGDSIDLIAITNLPVDSIRWSPDPFIDCRNCLIQPIKPLNTTTYTVEVINEAGCRSRDDIQVIISKDRRVYIPNAFSPNEDGRNDFFTIYGGQGIERIHSLQVFSRWGEMMYEITDLDPGDEEMGWNGRFNTRLMPNGVYTYITRIEFIDGAVEMFTGSVNLIR